MKRAIMKIAMFLLPLQASMVAGFMMQCSVIRIRMTSDFSQSVEPGSNSARATTPFGRRAFVQGAVASIPMVVAATGAVADNEIIEKMVTEKRIGVWTEPEVTNKAYMDVSIGGTPAGRLVISLYGKVVPNTVKNFISLLTGDNDAGVSYAGTEAYRVLDGLNIQMGAIGSRSGKEGVSSTGENIPQENFDIPHRKEGLLSMVRNQDKMGDSRFFISIKDDAGWADDRYVAFGRVSEGMNIVHQIEQVKVEGGSNRPRKPVIVETCGLL